MNELTELLDEWRRGDDVALEQALPELYAALRRLAGRHLANESPNHTLETRDLVHEAFFRLNDQRHVAWNDRTHFLAIAGRMMRRILIDHARRRQVRARAAEKLELDESPLAAAHRGVDLLALDLALDRLAETDRGLAQIVELKFFAGLKHREIAALLGSSEPTVRRRFRVAKAWLYRDLSGDEPAPATEPTDGA
ncbi:MAG: ECF-type sigma factor [Acidobacteriota bacterium]